MATEESTSTYEKLTLHSIEARPVVLKLERPVVVRIATITRGIGRAISALLAADGRAIVCAGIDRVANAATAVQVNGKAVVCDVGNQQDIEALIPADASDISSWGSQPITG